MAKSKTGLLLIAGAIGVVFWRLFQKTEAVKALNWNITGVDFNKNDRTLVVKLRLINPANAAIKIRSIVGDAIFKGEFVATIDYREEITLKPNEERTLFLAIKPNISLINIFSSLIQSKGNVKQTLSGKFELKGNINAENLVVPFTYSQEIKLV